MIDINTYLTILSKQLCYSKEEREKINNSFAYLEGKLFEHFRDRIEKVLIFGSYDRGTELPPSADPDSDVDILVIFKTNEFQPDTFLKHLQEFADKIYPRSEVCLFHPAITIILSHIKFELIPAYYNDSFWNGQELKIPAPRNKELKWITTDPSELKEDLGEKNRKENQMIIPLIKLIKYFNALHGRPFDSYIIEKFAVSVRYPDDQLRDYLFEFIDDLDENDQNEKQVKFISELKSRRKNLLLLEKGNLSDYLELELQKFLPLVLGT
jgi:predicted nucleotidyltransferase